MNPTGLVSVAAVSMIKKNRKNVFKCTQIETLCSQCITLKISKTRIFFVFSPVPLSLSVSYSSLLLYAFSRPLLPPHLRKFKPRSIKLNFGSIFLIIPYNITAVPNLADILTQTHTPIHTCASYPLSYLWDVADKWQRYSSANPVCFARQGGCACVSVCVCVCWRKKNRWGTQGDGGEHRQDSCFLIGWSEHPAELWILTEKIVCFDHVAHNYEKQVIFFISKLKPNVCAVEICYFPYMDFSWWGTGKEKKTAHERKGGEGKTKNKRD